MQIDKGWKAVGWQSRKSRLLTHDSSLQHASLLDPEASTPRRQISPLSFGASRIYY